jgi:hypothetical protein
MGLMAVFKPNLAPGEIWERASTLEESKVPEGERGSLIQIATDGFEGVKVQVFRNCITVFCDNLKELSAIKVWLSQRLRCELGEPIHVKHQGQRPAYYRSLEEVKKLLGGVKYPPNINPLEFKDFACAILGKYCEGDKITIPEASQLTGCNLQKAERFLEFMLQLGFAHIKPPIHELNKVYYIGSTPAEEFEYGQESRESTAGKMGFDLFKRAAGFVRPAYIGASPSLSGEDKAKEFWKWYDGDGYWCEVDLLVGTTPIWTVLGIICANELRKLPSGASGPQTF